MYIKLNINFIFQNNGECEDIVTQNSNNLPNEKIGYPYILSRTELHMDAPKIFENTLTILKKLDLILSKFLKNTPHVIGNLDF